MRIAIFGGAFDPPHLGHRELLKETLRLEFFDQIWLIPTFSPPLKMNNRNNASVASPKDRLEMVQLLIDDLHFPRYSGLLALPALNEVEGSLPNVSRRRPRLTRNRFWMRSLCSLTRMTKDARVRVLDLEIKRGGKSYTIETVRELKRIYPENKFSFLIGSDWVANLGKWYKIDELYKEVEFISLPRTKVSSSAIREKIKNGESIKGLVSKKVEQYIIRHHLYQ